MLSIHTDIRILYLSYPPGLVPAQGLHDQQVVVLVILLRKVHSIHTHHIHTYILQLSTYTHKL